MVAGGEAVVSSSCVDLDGVVVDSGVSVVVVGGTEESTSPVVACEVVEDAARPDGEPFVAITSGGDFVVICNLLPLIFLGITLMYMLFGFALSNIGFVNSVSVLSSHNAENRS